MESFVQAACSVLGRISGTTVRAGLPDLLGATFQTASVNIATRISGSLNGDIVYSMSGATGQNLASIITGGRVRGFGRLAGSGLARLGNMLAEETGKLLNEVGFDCDVSGPTVFHGMNVEFASVSPALAVTIDTELGQVDVNVAVRNGQQN
jgi:chemotaxis protein CheX